MRKRLHSGSRPASRLVALLGALLLLAGVSQAAAQVAILDTTVYGGTSSPEAQAASAAGYAVHLIPPATWQTMTTADFAAYDALVLGDPDCQVGTTAVAAATATADVWAPAVDGNVILIGADPVWHINHHDPVGGAQALNDLGMAFALSGEGTGAYITLSCYYHSSGSNTLVEFLGGFGTFTVVGAGTTGALNDVHIVAAHPALAGLTDAHLSNWSNSVHENFEIWPSSWPDQFEVLAIAEHSAGTYTAGDGTVGYPYILARGVIPAHCGDGQLDPGEECDDGNNDDGDGCDAACNIEACPDDDGDGICNEDDLCAGDDATGDSDGDGICDDIDPCPADPGNDIDGDGLCADADNCPDVSNSDQFDTDLDGLGDACDPDDDNDGVLDPDDNCVLDYNPDQADWDGDGAGDVCDTDADGDGVLDAYDSCLNTEPGDIVDATGCSIDDLCSCKHGWKNHGGYVSCVARTSESFLEQGLITEEEKDVIVSTAAQSECGRKK